MCSVPTQDRTWTPFHAQDEMLASSSWVDQAPNFRQEIRQSYCRNDPVKYDLDDLVFCYTINSGYLRRDFNNLALVNTKSNLRNWFFETVYCFSSEKFWLRPMIKFWHRLCLNLKMDIYYRLTELILLNGDHVVSWSASLFHSAEISPSAILLHFWV